MEPIDLRSDTVTLPTGPMRDAMARAEVGDDVFGEDPSVNRLQDRAAELLGKEAALFFPSGTMANQACLRGLTRPGDVVLASHGAHILRYESGAAAALSGLQIQTLGSDDGLFSGSDVRAHVQPAGDSHHAPTTLVSVENTHNAGGGRIVPIEGIKEVASTARDLGLALHMDGARLWNAVIASGTPAASWAEPFDTVSFCLSKGLGAPVGSLVCTSAEVASRLHRIRKMLGGGMRQAGVLAAAGLYALEHHVERLAEDHQNARLLAQGLAELGLEVEGPPDTNIVMFRVPDAPELLSALASQRVGMIPFSATRIRAVTHLGIDRRDIEEALVRIATAVESRADDAVRRQPPGSRGPDRAIPLPGISGKVPLALPGRTATLITIDMMETE